MIRESLSAHTPATRAMPSAFEDQDSRLAIGLAALVD